MRGVVTHINQQRGMVAVSTDDGFSIVEIIEGGHFELQDEVSWNEHKPLGIANITNRTRGASFRVFFQDHDVSRERLAHALLLV